MGVWDLDIPRIPAKDGSYEYKNGNLVYKAKGRTKGIVVGPYIPPKIRIGREGSAEPLESYKKRVAEDINRIISEIEESKDHIDAIARKKAIDSSYILGDTGLTFGKALKNASGLFAGEGDMKKIDITIPGIIVRSAKAGIEEIGKNIVGDLEKGFSLGDFFSKYGPALNEAIWRFGYGYGKNGITNRHLLYMLYLLKKYNILYAMAAEIMELCMTRGIYLLFEAVLFSKPDISDKDNFLEKVKKFAKAAGKEVMDLFKAIEGLFWIFAAGPVSDLICEKIDKIIFEPLDLLIMDLLDIRKDKMRSRKRKLANEDYEESFEEIYNGYYKKIDQALKDALADAGDIKVDLGEIPGDAFKDFLEKMADRYSLITKIFGAEKAYTVYNIKNIGDNGIKVVKEDNIDGPGLVYGSKLVVTQAGTHWGNIVFFGKLEGKKKPVTGRDTENKDITGVFSNMAVHDGIGKLFTRKITEAGILTAELSFLRKKIVFTEERETGFTGLNRLHGDIDDISILLKEMYDSGSQIDNIPDLVAYCCEEGKAELQEYIKELEGNRSNTASLETPKREKFFLIIYEGEKVKKNEKKEKCKIFIDYPTDDGKEKTEYVEKLKEKLPEIYEKAGLIFLRAKNAIFLPDSESGKALDYDLYYVEKISLEEIAREKGIILLEQKRGRLKEGQSYIGDFRSIEEIREYNKEQQKKRFFNLYKLEISPEGDYIIFYLDSVEPLITGTEDTEYRAEKNPFSNPIFLRNMIGRSNTRITDVMFPDEKYKANGDYLYGSANAEDRPAGTRKLYEFWVGTDSRKHYDKASSNPESKILIHGKEIGKNLKRRTEWENFIDYVQKQHEYEEIFNFDDGRTLELRYIYDMNGGFILPARFTRYPYLKIQYRYIDRNEKDNEDFDKWNSITIKEFADLDYGIDIPEIGDSLTGSRSSNNMKKESRLEKVDMTEITDKGKGKIKVNGKYLTASGITEIETGKTRKKYIIKENETLWGIAAEYFNGDGSRWVVLEKEDGSNFTEEEAKKIQAGTTIYIPAE